jgi:hypothetical protein
MPLSNGMAATLSKSSSWAGAPIRGSRTLVEITLVDAGFHVRGSSFDETFTSRFKAMMAAHAVALGDATAAGSAIAIVFPEGWGDAILIEPHHP